MEEPLTQLEGAVFGNHCKLSIKCHWEAIRVSISTRINQSNPKKTSSKLSESEFHDFSLISELAQGYLLSALKPSNPNPRNYHASRATTRTGLIPLISRSFLFSALTWIRLGSTIYLNLMKPLH